MTAAAAEPNRHSRPGADGFVTPATSPAASVSSYGTAGTHLAPPSTASPSTAISKRYSIDENEADDIWCARHPLGRLFGFANARRHGCLGA